MLNLGLISGWWWPSELISSMCNIVVVVVVIDKGRVSDDGHSGINRVFSPSPGAIIGDGDRKS